MKLKYMKKINLLMLFWILEALNTNAEKKDKEQIDFAVGGQAVIEGVMMRSPNSIEIAVRKTNGDIKIREKNHQTIIQRYKFLNIPILRGIINLFEMMYIGTDAINYSANEFVEEEEIKRDTKMAKIIDAFMFVLSFVFAMALSIGLFKFIPLWITTWLEAYSTSIESNYIVFNLVDGILKMTIFLAYILLLTMFESFRRVFEYHGAEHKAIFNYEAKEPLTVKNSKKQTRFHPRCGTSFILIVFLISIAVYTFIPKNPDFWQNLAVRVAVLPFIAGISYEFLKFSAKNIDNFIVKVAVKPGLWFQRLTTKEPNDEQLEVGIKSLEAALAMEKKAK